MEFHRNVMIFSEICSQKYWFSVKGSKKYWASVKMQWFSVKNTDFQWKNSENNWVSVKNTDFQWICSQKYWFSVKMQWKWLSFSENAVKNTEFQWKNSVDTEHVFEYIPQNSSPVRRRRDGLIGTRPGPNPKVSGSNLMHSAFWGQLHRMACAACQW